jgi:hypothetical protein
MTTGLDRLEQALKARYVPADARYELRASSLPSCLPATDVERILLASSDYQARSLDQRLKNVWGRDPFILAELHRVGTGYGGTLIRTWPLQNLVFTDRMHPDLPTIGRTWIAPEEIRQALQDVRILLRTRAQERTPPASQGGATWLSLEGTHQQLLVDGSNEVLDSFFSRSLHTSDEQVDHLPLDLAVESLAAVLLRARWQWVPLDAEGRDLFDRWFVGLTERRPEDAGCLRDGYVSPHSLLRMAGDYGSAAVLSVLERWSGSSADERLEAHRAMFEIRSRTGMDLTGYELE